MERIRGNFKFIYCYRKTLSKEQIDKISEKLGKRGHTALIAAEITKEDRDNVIREAIDLKTKETSRNHPIITKFPIVGSLVKAGFAAKHRNEARAAVNESGDLNAAFSSLNLESSQSKILNNQTENVTDRAWQALENAGYSTDNQIERAGSRLDQNEKVEKMDDASQRAVKQALSEYYTGLSDKSKSKEELDQAFNEQIEDAFIGQSSISLGAINQQKANLEKLVDDPEIQADQVKTYIDQHLTLYKATMKEGLYTQQKVDGIINAVDKAGLAGGVLYALAGKEARGKLHDALGTIGGAGTIGAAVGAVAGAIRGAEKANVKLSNAEINAATGVGETDARQTGLFAKLEGYKRTATGEEKYLAGIEELRDRKDADDLISNLNQLMENYDPSNTDTQGALTDAYADIIARGQFSSDKHIDLIRYQDNRSALEQKLSEAEKMLYGDDQNVVNNLIADENSDLSKLIRSKTENLNDNYSKANKLRVKFMIRSALVNAATGALMGAGAGAAFHFISEHMPEGGLLGSMLGTQEANAESVKPGKVELIEDADGGYAVQLGDETLIGEGDASGIEFDDSGELTAESKEMLEDAGVHVEEKITEHTFEHATKQVDIDKFFSPENKDANNLTEITSRSWITGADGQDQVLLGKTHMDGDGNIIMKVAPAADSNLKLDGMKMMFTPGNGNIDTAIAVDVKPDGTIEIPAGSPAASMFDGKTFQGGYAELARETSDGHIDVYSTIGDGRPSVESITVDNPNATYNTYDYTFSIDGQDYDVSTPETITASARMEALNGIESLKGTGEPIGYEATGEVTGLTTNSGESVEVEHFEHHGGYSDTVDSYFGEKDGVYNSGASVVRAMVGEEGKGLSATEVDRIFLDKINSGEIAEGYVVEEYLKTIGNSPEAITTTRAMMGGFEMDLDGDGTSELIDTQDEVNIASDILSRDPEAYDAFVNDTYEMFYDKIEGGNIRFIDYTKEQYQFTTWGVLEQGTNNVLQRLGAVGDRSTDGVGIVFEDKNGNSIYDEETARKLWHLPEGYDLDYIADRLNCDQKTSRGSFAGGETTGDETTGRETTGNEGTGNEGTGNEGTGEEGTGRETTGEEGTGNEGTGEEGTGRETTGEEGTGNEGTGEEGTGDETTGEETTGDEGTDIEQKDAANLERIDRQIDEDIKQDIGTDDIKHNPNPGVTEDELTEEPAADEYEGTEPETIQNEVSEEAEPVQEQVSEDNDYSADQGGANAEEYTPVEENNAAQEASDKEAIPVEEAPSSKEEVEDELEDLGIE